MEYPHCEMYKGICINYYLIPNLMPTRLDIEPIYEYVDGGRYADGRLAKTEKRLIRINVYGVYEEDMQKLLNTPIIDPKELYKRVLSFYS